MGGFILEVLFATLTVAIVAAPWVVRNWLAEKKARAEQRNKPFSLTGTRSFTQLE
jgi:hypothetical protein